MPARSPAVRRSTAVFVAAGVVLVLLVAGAVWLLARPGGDGTDGTPVGTWPATSDRLAVDTEVRVDGERLLVDGWSPIDTGRPIERYVVAGDGVYFLEALDQGTSELFRATPDGVTGTGAHPQRDTLHSSPDGRYLGFLESARRPWVAVVVDLETGEEVVRSTRGMGGHVMVEEQYEEFEPDLVGLTDDLAYVLTTDDVLAFDLGTGDAEVVVADRADAFWEEPWFADVEKRTRRASYVDQDDPFSP